MTEEEVLLGRDVYHKITDREQGEYRIECGHETLIQKIRTMPRHRAEVFRKPCQVCYKQGGKTG